MATKDAKNIIRITERSAGKIRTDHVPTGKPQFHWDVELKGFGLIGSAVTKGVVSYIAQHEMKGRKSRRVTVGRVGVVTQQDARERARELLAGMQLGVDPKQRNGKMTLQHALDDHLDKSGLRPKTQKTYAELINTHLNDWLGLRLGDITPEMVVTRHRDIVAKLRANGKDGAALANTCIRALSAVYGNAASQDATLPPNPVRLKRKWHKVHRRERKVKNDDLPRFYQAMMALENTVQRDYLMLLMFSGMRRTEAATLRWRDIDFAGRQILLSHRVTKGKKKLDLPVCDVVLGMLMARKQRGGGPNDWIFPANSRSGHVEESGYPFELIENATGLRLSAHDMRRTYSSIAERMVSFITLKVLMNHSTGEDVTSGYVIPEELHRDVQRVGDRLRELCGVKPEIVAALQSGLRQTVKTLQTN